MCIRIARRNQKFSVIFQRHFPVFQGSMGVRISASSLKPVPGVQEMLNCNLMLYSENSQGFLKVAVYATLYEKKSIYCEKQVLPHLNQCNISFKKRGKKKDDMSRYV